jgi:hypothetical protein
MRPENDNYAKMSEFSNFFSLFAKIEFLADFFSESDSGFDVGLLPRPLMLPRNGTPTRKPKTSNKVLKMPEKKPICHKKLSNVIPKHSPTSPIYNYVPAPTMRPGRAACQKSDRCLKNQTVFKNNTVFDMKFSGFFQKIRQKKFRMKITPFLT